MISRVTANGTILFLTAARQAHFVSIRTYYKPLTTFISQCLGLTSCCLPCLTYGKTQSRRNDPSLRSFSYLNGPVCIQEILEENIQLIVFFKCVIWSFLSLGAVQWIMQTVSRGEMREQYGIEGSCCGDCCISTFCGCCALIQEEKEAELRTRPELVGYQRPHDMAIP